MRAVITGAGGGIGEAVAARLTAVARAGGERPRLLLVDVATDRMSALGERLRDAGAEVTLHVADLADPASCREVGEAARSAFGEGLDALVSNAGVMPPDGPMLTLSVEDWDLQFAVNARATWLLACALHPLLSAAEGAVVATASIASSYPTPPSNTYAASKAALATTIRQLAVEWGPDGINCNCVSPGPTHTPMTEVVYGDAELKRIRGGRIPLGHVAGPDEIAAVITFLASPEGAYLTGLNIPVDGGLTANLMPLYRGS